MTDINGKEPNRTQLNSTAINKKSMAFCDICVCFFTVCDAYSTFALGFEFGFGFGTALALV